jgi:hypothetical protein
MVFYHQVTASMPPLFFYLLRMLVDETGLRRPQTNRRDKRTGQRHQPPNRTTGFELRRELATNGSSERTSAGI